MTTDYAFRGAKTGLALVLAVLAVLALVGCASPRRAFEAAQAQDSRQAYRDFVREFPNSEYTPQAWDRIAEFDYQSAVREGTVEAFRKYLRSKPKAEYADDIRARLAKMDEQDVAKARELDTAEAWEDYLEQWPKSDHRAEAERSLKAASMREAFAQAKQAGTSEALEAFLKEWPRSPKAEEAKTMLESLSFAKIQENPTLALCRAHLARFRDGAHAAEVAQIMKPLAAEERIASASETKTRGDLTSVIEDYPDHEAAGRLRELLAQRGQEVTEQCQAILGGPVDRLECDGVFLEACAWAKIARHDAFAGEYLGILASVRPDAKSRQLDANTFVEYADGTFGRKWVIWWPDWTYGDYVMSKNGTSISAEIEMPGLEKGEAWGRHSGMIALGYGSMLFHSGPMSVKWNMAYTNAGRTSGSVTWDVSAAPSMRRALLLFPKHDASVKQISIGGAAYRVTP